MPRAGEEQLFSGTLQFVYQSLADSHKWYQLSVVVCHLIPPLSDTRPFPLALHPHWTTGLN